MGTELVVKRQHIVVAGYFNHKNLGDDLFKDIWQYIFTKKKFMHHTVDYVELDKLRDHSELKSCDILLFAGGDVMNYYFLAELKNIVEKFSFKGKLFALSVGIPYQVVIVDGLLDQFDFIMCRAKGDAFSLKKRYGDNHVKYFPDISVYLPELYKAKKVTAGFNGIKSYKTASNRLNVGIFLTRNIYENNPHYGKVVEDIAITLDKIVETEVPGIHGFEIFLIPFNNNSKNICEDDCLINKDIFNAVKNKNLIHDVSQRFNVEEMWFIFKNQLDMNITMRYHSHMYSIVSKVPLVSLYTTRKVQNLLLDSQLSTYSYALPVDENDLPIEFNSEKFIEKFNQAFSERLVIIENMKKYVETYSIDDVFEKTLQSLIEKPSEKVVVKQTANNLNTIKNTIQTLVKYIWTEEKKDFTSKDLAMITDEVYNSRITLSMLVSSKDKKKRAKMAEFLAALACFELIHIPYPKYHYGMSLKILNDKFKAKDDFTWVWGDHQKTNDKLHVENQIMKRQHFNATFVGIEDFKGCHRSGWQYVLDNLLSFHSEKTDLIFDNYVDRTFHWAHDIYKYTDIIPFKKKWCGFIHHTFDETYSPYNVPNLFRNETFLESLQNCYALFTLSNDLATKVQVLLQQYGYKNVLVKSFTHPTETSKYIFSFEKFSDNNKKKIVQIGAWLRDNYAIYKLTPHRRTRSPFYKQTPIQKAVLRGKNMGNYFKPDNLKISIENAGIDDEKFDYVFHKNGLEGFTANKFVHGLIRSIHDEWNSVEILNTLSDEEYDKMLQDNIVFLKLVDASAVNTIIECVVRCTPVLVNRHPAVEEMLGTEYPFYYDDLTEAGVKMNDLELIKKTNKYLVALPKKRFSMEYFLNDIDNWFRENC